MIGTGCRIPAANLTRPYPPGRVVVKQAGAVLRGINFSGCNVDVQANDVRFVDCLLDAYALNTTPNGPVVAPFVVRQYPGFRGLVVEYATIDGRRVGSGAGTAVMSDDGAASVRDSIFVNLPADAINLPAGEVTRCRISSLGWGSGAHADGIVVPRQTGPIAITCNDIDGTPDDAPADANHLIQICPALGAITQGVTIATNVLTGGTYSIAVYGAGGAYPISNVAIRGNVLGGGLYGDIYPTTRPADLVIAGNVRLGTGQPVSA
jgi:hypothetical protein